jgi:hypothetical protein
MATLTSSRRLSLLRGVPCESARARGRAAMFGGLHRFRKKTTILSEFPKFKGMLIRLSEA